MSAGTSASAAKDHTANLLSYMPGAGKLAAKIDYERLLEKVHPEDKTLVCNVIQTMQILRSHDFVRNFEIVKHKKGYDIVGTLASNFDNELIITSADFEILQSVSCARVNTVMVQVSAKALELVVRVFAHDTPITFSTVQVSHINKKTRWL
jgi:hypothetical protein